jgi:hypothetical protein
VAFYFPLTIIILKRRRTMNCLKGEVKILTIISLFSVCFLIAGFSQVYAGIIEHRVNQTRAGDQTNPAIATNGTNCLVVWQDTPPTVSRVSYIRARLLDKRGFPLGPEITISLANHIAYNPAVASDGADYLVVWAESSPQKAIMGAFIDSSGIVTNRLTIENNIFIQDPTDVAVASAGTNYLAIYKILTDPDPHLSISQVYGKIVNKISPFVSPSAILLTPGHSEWTSSHYIAVASGGTDYLATWEYLYQHGSYLEGQYVNLDGSLGIHLNINPGVAGYYINANDVTGITCGYYTAWEKVTVPYPGTCAVIEGKGYCPIGPIGQISTNSGSELERSPAIIGSLDNYFYTVWQGSDIKGPGVFGQKLTIDGIKVGPEFKINRLKYTDALNPDTIFVGQGITAKLVTVWQGDYAGGIPDFDIYVRAISK